MNMNPIAMKCTQEQFEAIKPKLEQIEGVRFEQIYNFCEFEYLVNNLNGVLGVISNLSNRKRCEFNRAPYNEWDEQLFLEYCGYKPKVTLDDPYIVRCKTREQSEQVVSWVKKRNVNLSFRYDYIINHKGLLDIHHNTIPEEVAHLPILTFEEWKELKANYTPMTKQKLTVPITDVLEIHKIACNGWKDKIVKYISRVNFYQEIKFTQLEVDEMFKAATASQLPVLERIFGKKAKAIDWDKIKTGSKVMIQYTGQHCGGWDKINVSEPVDVVFYKTPHYIFADGKFGIDGDHRPNCTFYQNGNYVMFAADKNTDYITEVIQY